MVTTSYSRVENWPLISNQQTCLFVLPFSVAAATFKVDLSDVFLLGLFMCCVLWDVFKVYTAECLGLTAGL